MLILSIFIVPKEINALGVPHKKLDARIMTFNIHAGIGSDAVYDRERIAKEIKAAGADIVGLQEVDVHWGMRSNNENLIKELAKDLNMHYAFAPIYDFEPTADGAPRRQYGVGVLSKYPILQTTNHSITRLSTQDPNPVPSLSPGFLEVLLNIKGTKLSFYVTHLDFREDPSVRNRQVQDMLEIMSNNRHVKILAGDMNTTPCSPEISPLFRYFKDAWSEINSSPGFTYSAENPTQRIDYLFMSNQIMVKSAEVPFTLASDHLPVIADITLK